MTEIKATLSNYRQSPRKVRLVADLARGKSVKRARKELDFLNKKAASVIKKLLMSAVANAKHNKGIKEDELRLKEISVNVAPTLKRFRAGARGQAYALKKRASHISIVLEENKKIIENEVKKS